MVVCLKWANILNFLPWRVITTICGSCKDQRGSLKRRRRWFNSSIMHIFCLNHVYLSLNRRLAWWPVGILQCKVAPYPLRVSGSATCIFSDAATCYSCGVLGRVNASRVDEGLKGLLEFCRANCMQRCSFPPCHLFSADEGNTSMIRGDLNKEDNGEE